MAGSLNKVTLIGNLGHDPEVRVFQNGGRVVNLRLATTERWQDRTTGERRERTEWHTIAIYAEALQKVAEQYLRRGSSVYVEGALETRKWQDQGGADRYSLEVTIRAYRGELQMLDRGNERGEGLTRNGGPNASDGHGRNTASPDRSTDQPGQTQDSRSNDQRRQQEGRQHDQGRLQHNRGQPRTGGAAGLNNDTGGTHQRNPY